MERSCDNRRGGDDLEAKGNDEVVFVGDVHHALEPMRFIVAEAKDIPPSGDVYHFIGAVIHVSMSNCVVLR